MAKDFNDEIESDPVDDEIESDPVIEWLEAQLKLMSARQLGLKYHIDPSVITRNMKNYRQGKGLASTFRTRIEGIIEQERLDKLHRQQLADQAAAAELARKEALERKAEATERAEREAEEDEARKRAAQIAKKAKAQERADAARQRREMEDAFIRSCEYWEDRFREAGYLREGQMVEGDADELLHAGISDLDYVDIGVAAVALLPDDYVIWRDKTVAFFREGVSYKARLQPTAIPKGQPRPKMIGNLSSSVVYRDPLPDQLLRYGKEGAKLIAEWGRLTDAYGHLAKGSLPRFVHPETVEAFERLIDIEEHSGYVFEDSCLGADARDRLKSLQRRAVMPVIGLTSAEMTWDATKSATRWVYSEGWKWLAGTVAALVAVAVVVGVAWGMWEALKWGWGVLTALWTWSTANGAFLLIGGLILCLIGEVVWWVWPKKRDTVDQVAVRVAVVMFAVLFLGVVGTGALLVASDVREMVAAFEGYDPYNQTIVIP